MKIRDVQKKYGFDFKSSFGQNFLNNNLLIESIVNELDIDENDVILEIGPGFGVLTKKLLTKAREVICIEIDKSAVNILKNEFRYCANLEIINGDFLKIDLNNVDKLKCEIKVIANIPYYITTPILEKLFTSNLNIKFIAIMVQKEVGDRILAKPSTKNYGSLTVFVNYYSKVSIIKNVPSHNFVPKPKVDSVFLKFDILKVRLFNDRNIENEFMNFVKKCFTMRRKNLFNVFGQFDIGRERLTKISLDLEIDFNQRIENLTLNNIQSVFKRIKYVNQFLC